MPPKSVQILLVLIQFSRSHQKMQKSLSFVETKEMKMIKSVALEIVASTCLVNNKLCLGEKMDE